jgi:muramoyltetrapeptide carboxypeptidase
MSQISTLYFGDIFTLPNVFIVSPSYLIEKKGDFLDGINLLSHLGFTVLNPDFPEKPLSPYEKANQLLDAFQNPKVEVILALRGGFSAIKVLPHLDFAKIRKHPKIFAGFSDLSALLNPIMERAGFVTLHAPMVINLNSPTDFSINSFLNAVKGFPDKNLFHQAHLETYQHGVATGVLKGGNLVTLSSLIGTAWDVDPTNAILFFEDVDEEFHEVDRYLTQWTLAGKFNKIKGLILGDFRGLKSEDVFTVLASQLDIDFPVIHTSNIGHVENKITLPIGAKVEMDTVKKHLLIKQMAFPGV